MTKMILNSIVIGVTFPMLCIGCLYVAVWIHGPIWTLVLAFLVPLIIMSYIVRRFKLL